MHNTHTLYTHVYVRNMKCPLIRNTSKFIVSHYNWKYTLYTYVLGNELLSVLDCFPSPLYMYALTTSSS